MAYQKFGGWFDGNGDATLLDNTQTGLQYSDRLEHRGRGTRNMVKPRTFSVFTRHKKTGGPPIRGLFRAKVFYPQGG
ncbi:hypothetical protein KCA24_35400, partial [Escherichia coli]|nr:hypothetical protein [Escherichia coli]